ncbi:MAG: 6-phosphogluconolactonase [Candidatus Doudnabacteria bacterium]|nr:6-phosphogluconolactonase [Candidatus Doudnabacteria bacterium]
MNNTFQIFKQADKEAAAAEAGEYLNNYLAENKKTPILLLLSGGSALSVLDYIGQTSLGENLTVSVLDERFSEDPSINNFSQLQKHDFYQLALNVDVSFFGTLPRPAETIDQLALRWEANLKKWKEENPNGLIMATLGMGADGHTAGIFPFPEDAGKFHKLFENDNWVAAYSAAGKNKFPERLTTTATFFKLIDFGFVYACGKEKSAMLKQALAGKNEFSVLPACAWQNIKEVMVFTDVE